MEILHKTEGHKGVFIAMEENVQAGEMTYTNAGTDKMIIDHTEVDPSFSGKGIGVKLVNAAVEYARAHQIKILPLCPFAHKVMHRSDDYLDVLFKRLPA